MAKMKKIPSPEEGKPCNKATSSALTNNVECPTIDDTPDIKEVIIEDPTLLQISCPAGVSPELFNKVMQPLTRKVCNGLEDLNTLMQQQVCLFSKFVENSNKKVIKCDICFEDGTSGVKLIEHNIADGNLTVIGVLDSLGDPAEDKVIVPCSDFESSSLDSVCYEDPEGNKYSVQIVKQFTNGTDNGFVTIIIDNTAQIIDQLPEGSVPCSIPIVKVIDKKVCLEDGTTGIMWFKIDLLTEETEVIKITNCEGKATDLTVVECSEFDIIETTACSGS